MSGLLNALSRAMTLAATIAFVAVACTSSPPPTVAPAPETKSSQTRESKPTLPLTSEEAMFNSKGLNSFAKENLGSFEVTALSNGIPVIFKKNSTNRIFALRIVLRGHTVFTPPEKAGIEAITLGMLTKGSEKYPYEEIQRLLYEKTSAIGPAFGSSDMTSFGLTTLTKYVPELVDVFTDSFLHPRWDPARFAELMNDFKVSKQRNDNDPYSVSVTLLHKQLFANHPYYAEWSGVDDSLANVTLQDVVDYYNSMIVPSRLFVVAVGDFDSRQLFGMLDSTLGRMSGPTLMVPHPGSLAKNVRSKLVEKAFPESKGLAYLRGGFVLPPPDSSEYPAVLIALNMLDDILYDTVRTQHGAAYSVSARTYGLAANYGSISIYKTTEPGSVKPYVDESIRILASGQCLAARIDASAAGKSGIGAQADTRDTKGSYVPISAALSFYKDQFVTGFYAGQATNLSVSSQIASSVVYHGDFRDYLLLMDRIAAVTPEQIVSVTGRYLLDAPMLWVAVGSEDVLSTINRSDYESTTAGSNKEGEAAATPK